MKVIFGITHSSAHQLREYLEEWLDTLPEVRRKKFKKMFLGYGAVYDRDVHVVFTPSITCVQANREALEASDCVVFVFDNPIVLAQARIPLLDAVSVDSVSWTFLDMDADKFIHHLREGLNGKASASFSSEDLDLLPTLLKQRQGQTSEALLNAIAISTVPAKRREITAMFVDWLYSGRPVKDLVEMLTIQGVDARACKVLSDHLESEYGVRIRELFREITRMNSPRKVKGAKGGKSAVRSKASINYDKLSARFEVDTFDVRFLNSTSRGSSSQITHINKNSQDVFAERQKAAKVAGKQTKDQQAVTAVVESNEADGIWTDDSLLDFSEFEGMNYE